MTLQEKLLELEAEMQAIGEITPASFDEFNELRLRADVVDLQITNIQNQLRALTVKDELTLLESQPEVDID